MAWGTVIEPISCCNKALLARTAAPDALTTLLAQWSTRLWYADRLGYLLVT